MCPLKASYPDYTGGADPALATDFSCIGFYHRTKTNLEKSVHIIQEKTIDRTKDSHLYEHSSWLRSGYWSTAEFVIRTVDSIFLKRKSHGFLVKCW